MLSPQRGHAPCSWLRLRTATAASRSLSRDQGSSQITTYLIVFSWERSDCDPDRRQPDSTLRSSCSRSARLGGDGATIFYKKKKSISFPVFPCFSFRTAAPWGPPHTRARSNGRGARGRTRLHPHRRCDLSLAGGARPAGQARGQGRGGVAAAWQPAVFRRHSGGMAGGAVAADQQPLLGEGGSAADREQEPAKLGAGLSESEEIGEVRHSCAHKLRRLLARRRARHAWAPACAGACDRVGRGSPAGVTPASGGAAPSLPPSPRQQQR